jgi:hypothetical protein
VRSADVPENNEALHRRIGRILVEKELITADELDVALAEHAATGQLVGEICVARFGLERIRLADVLAEQWDEMQREQALSVEPPGPAGDTEAEKMLRTLLDEARETRLVLASRTAELARRLAALEEVVTGIGEALTEPAPKPARASSARNGGTPKPAGTRRTSPAASAKPPAPSTRKRA